MQDNFGSNEYETQAEGGGRLSHNRMHNYTDKNKIGNSPEKRGPVATPPLLFWNLLNCHFSMSQLEGKVGMKPWHLKALLGKALTQTTHDHLNVNNMYT